MERSVLSFLKEKRSPPGLRQAWLKRGTIVYHGTSSEDEFENLNGPAWVSNSVDVAKEFIGWTGSEGRERILRFSVKKSVRLLVINSTEEIQELGEYLGIGRNFTSFELAEGIANAGYDGWIIPENYGYDAADILLVEPMEILSYDGEEEEIDESWVRRRIDGIF